MNPGQEKVPANEFIELFRKHGAAKTARIIGGLERNVHERRRRLEKTLNITINGPGDSRQPLLVEPNKHPARRHYEVKDGIVLVGSDAHYWPGIISTSHRAFVAFCKEFRPKGVILNGDMLDCSRISRFPPIGWEDRPALQAELEAASERTDEIFKASSGAWHVWNLGNHDGRFETRLAMQANEYARIKGFHLKDHFPGWQPAWSTWIHNQVVVKHRFKGGIYAPRNNTLYSGKTMVAGHLHAQQCIPFTDYEGTRWGVDAGCMADPSGPQFVDYCEDNPTGWREGFCLLTFYKGKLLDPELVRVWDADHVVFRGKLIGV